MTRHSRSAHVLALSAVAALTLAGCASTGADAGGDGDSDGRVTVVASTSVYAQIAQEIGGDLVDAHAIVSSTSQDPHSFEPSARDQLEIKRADLIIENGGGYDAFVDALIEASGSTAPVITAVTFSHDWPDNEGHSDDASTSSATEGSDDASTSSATEGSDHTSTSSATEEPHDHEHSSEDHGHVEGFNEHVWYDPHTVEHLAEGIAHELSELMPAEADTFEANSARFATGIAGLEDSLSAIDTAHAGEKIFATEPVSLYLVAAAGLQNVTPDAFSEAVEEGQDVAPATLLESLKLIQSGDVRAVIANSQTGGAETTQVIAEAGKFTIPVIEYTETLPDDQTYLSWMQQNIEALAGALGE